MRGIDRAGTAGDVFGARLNLAQSGLSPAALRVARFIDLTG